MRGLISFSLYGPGPFYNRGAVANAKLRNMIYPGWDMRVYCDERVTVADELRELGVQVETRTTPLVGISGMYWRYEAASDLAYDYIIFRDTDSRLGFRERAAVDEWIRLGRAPLHLMHDHPHQTNAPIQGGMWGIRGGVVRDMASRIARGSDFQAWGDLWFLRDYVLAEFGQNVHRHGLMGEPFPPHGPVPWFVGEPVPPSPHSVSIITPTVGEPSLERMLRSVLRSGFPVSDRDELLLVTAPSSAPSVRRQVALFDWPATALRIIVSDDPGKPSHPPQRPARHDGIRHASGTHLVWMDDHCVFTDLAVAQIHAAILQAPDQCLVFRMLSASGKEFWQDQRLDEGNVEMPQFVCPSRHLGSHPPGHPPGHPQGASLDLVAAAVERSGRPPLFLQDRICQHGP